MSQDSFLLLPRRKWEEGHSLRRGEMMLTEREKRQLFALNKAIGIVQQEIKTRKILLANKPLMRDKKVEEMEFVLHVLSDERKEFLRKYPKAEQPPLFERRSNPYESH